ncbi:unnamed protein product [Eruca vesicaria subsp. sativa]|uniref:Uncharacterized protein n=1 Tax=Eruca vesicaria subsp. sativa TaxID=29727 RepID=A0ABC8KJS6_ERUVS|nr:unnamed protein product [Eruca vesicaria subsp. sativa]
MFNHIIAAQRNMALKQREYALTKKRSIHQMMDNKSLGSSSCTDVDKETLELNKKKKPRTVRWWDELDDAFNDLNSVVKGLPKSKDAMKKYERSLSLIQRGKFFDFSEDESHVSDNNKTNQDPLLGSYKTKNNISHVDSCFTFCNINDLIKDTNKGKERSLSLNDHDNFIDMNEDKILCESSCSSNKGTRHVTLEELGVSVEDLKSIPWKAFDRTWEIKSQTMDPWVGGYIKDMPSSAAD